jgi:phosphate transport system permease protein
VSLRRRAADRAAQATMRLAVVLALAPLAWIVVDLARRGMAAIGGVGFFTQGPPGDPSAAGGGVANGIVGTLLMVTLGGVLAVPLGIMGAVWLSEFAGQGRLGRAVRFFAEVMTGVPSIVLGIFVYALVVVATGSFSAVAGALALALVMWPLVLTTAEAMLRQVPRDVREAALALGVPRRRVVVKVVLPTAAGGLVTGVLLAVARAAGETAPLLFTALGNQFVSVRLDQPMSALPLEIFRGATSPFTAANQRAWAGALTVLALVLALSMTARRLGARRAPGRW